MHEHLDVAVHALIGALVVAVVRELLLLIKHWREPFQVRHPIVTRIAHKTTNLRRRRD